GWDVLVEAFARLHERAPDARLLLVGDGPARAAVCADLSACGLNGVVHCTGAVAPREVPGLLTSADVAVAPYPQATGFYFSPLKVYEYLAAGRAVVASRVGQLETVIRHDVNGLLCPPGDAGALAAALERLRCEPALRARLGRAARATVLYKHTWDAVAARVLELAAAVEVAVVAFAGLRALAAYYNTVGLALAGNRVLTAVRNELYAQLQRLSLSFHTRARTGDLIVRVTGDVGFLQDVVVTAFLPLLASGLTFVGMAAVMLWLNAPLALLAFATGPLFLLSTVRLSRRIRDNARRQREQQGAMAATAAESIGAVKVVHALSLEGT